MTLQLSMLLVKVQTLLLKFLTPKQILQDLNTKTLPLMKLQLSVRTLLQILLKLMQQEMMIQLSKKLKELKTMLLHLKMLLLKLKPLLLLWMMEKPLVKFKMMLL